MKLPADPGTSEDRGRHVRPHSYWSRAAIWLLPAVLCGFAVVGAFVLVAASKQPDGLHLTTRAVASLQGIGLATMALVAAARLLLQPPRLLQRFVRLKSRR